MSAALVFALAGLAPAAPPQDGPPAADPVAAVKEAWGKLFPPKPAPARAGVLADPVRVEADGKAIDTEVGHAAPFVADFDGDGVQDLLVGQFGQGLLWVYRNTGTNAKPKFAAGTKFQAGKADGRVPTG